MKALKIIGIVLAAIIALLVVVGLIAPKDFETKREIVINASEATVWKGISTFEAFNKWNPWSKLDPKMEVKDTGPGGNIGDTHYWKSDKAGEGTMTVQKVEPNKLLEYDLHFADGDMHNIGSMTMEKAEGGYKVAWGFKGHFGFPWNIMGLFMGSAINKDFDEGLANIKKLCESEPAAPAYIISKVDWAEKNCLSIRKVVEFNDFGKFFDAHLPKMYEAISKAKGTPGIPLGVYYDYDEIGKKADLAAAVPYEGAKVTSKDYPTLNLPARKAYSIDYYGDYEKMDPAYEAMDAKLKELGKEYPTIVVEEYITDPMVEKDTAKWLTKIYFFVDGEGK